MTDSAFAISGGDAFTAAVLRSKIAQYEAAAPLSARETENYLRLERQLLEIEESGVLEVDRAAGTMPPAGMEEEIARAIYASRLLMQPREPWGSYLPTRSITEKMCLEAARSVLAIIEPVLDATRRQERLAGVGKQTTALAQAQDFRRLYEEGLRVVRLYAGHDKMTDAEKVGAIVNHPHFAKVAP